MNYRYVDGREVFDDDNNGLLFGIESDEDFPEYVEWFKSAKIRDAYAKKNKMKIINKGFKLVIPKKVKKYYGWK